MKKLLIILLLLPILGISQSNYLNYPDYNEIINSFFSKYSAKEISTTTYLHFEKRPSGWYITITEYNPELKTIKEELYWDSKSEQYKPINFETISDDHKEKLDLKEQFLNDFSKRYFRICPYYGYKGWDIDVINEFKEMNNLPDSTLYALGRAYSSFANNLLNNNSGLAEKEHSFELAEGENCLTKSQIEKYRYYRHKAIETFNNVKELNPSYETIVGIINTKLSNEHITSFLDLRIYQNEQEADKELINGLYSDFYISTAKNYLNSCSKNAVLFTNGDNDTYPLLYVQSNLGFRKDVLVVNLSLLQTERYINSLRNKVLNAQGMNLSLDKSDLAKNKRDIVIIRNNIDEYMDIKELINFIKNDTNVLKYPNRNYFYIPTNKIKMDIGQKTMKWEISNQYIFLNHLIFLDLLATNKLNRPIHFAITIGIDNFFDLNDYFQLEGFAYKLDYTKKENDDNQLGYVNTKVMYDNIMNKFTWQGFKNIISHEKLLGSNYINNFHRLANALIEENKTQSAKKVLDKCMDLFPNEIISYDYLLISIIEDYYKIKEFKVANNIALQLVYNLKNSIDNHNDIKINSGRANNEFVLKMLKNIAEKYDQKEIIDEIEK